MTGTVKTKKGVALGQPLSHIYIINLSSRLSLNRCEDAGENAHQHCHHRHNQNCGNRHLVLRLIESKVNELEVDTLRKKSDEQHQKRIYEDKGNRGAVAVPAGVDKTVQDEQAAGNHKEHGGQQPVLVQLRLLDSADNQENAEQGGNRHEHIGGQSQLRKGRCCGSCIVVRCKFS